MRRPLSNTSGFRTLAVHGGVEPDPITGAIAPNIVVSANFEADFGDLGFSAAGTVEENLPFAYAREGHPNAQQLEVRMALLEGGEAAVTFASGIGAISGLLLLLLRPGDHIVVSDIGYAGAAEFTRGLLKHWGVEVTFADMSDLAEVKAAVRPDTKLVYAETLCNPVLKLTDIAKLAELTHSVGARLMVDSTFAPPALTRPLALGADFVVHSLTKYIGGHGDAVGGVVVGDAATMRELRQEIGTHLGAMLSPFNAWLILRGIETLDIRMAAYAKSAQRVAAFLESHPFVEEVRYPGLESYPQFDLAKRQMKSAGAMISFRVRDIGAFAETIDKLRVFTFAASLGLSRSLILYCDTDDLQRTTFKLSQDLLERYRRFAGDGFFRLSIGLEDENDLVADLKTALDAADLACRS